MDEIQKFLENSIDIGENKISVLSVIIALVVFIGTWIIVGFFKNLLKKLLTKRGAEVGQQYAISRLLSYLLWFVGIVVAVSILGINLKGLVIGSAALLVGVGIGLQQIFNDLFSGLILLFEGKVQVGDVIDMDGMVGRIDTINIRTSELRTLDNISVIVPNSKLISDKVINWSSNKGVARFHVPLTVAYGSDVSMIQDLIIECAAKQEGVLNRPKPTVFFGNFGDSALDLDLMFWSKEFTNVENIKSSIRYAINNTFKEHNITIPFPQMDVHISQNK